MALIHHRRSLGDLWWRKSAGRIAFGLVAFVIITVLLKVSLRSPSEPLIAGNSPLVELTLLQDAESKGAVCLDGSPPAYHIQRGYGSGSKNWLLHIEGGGWCNTMASCGARKMTILGSSTLMQPVVFSGILSGSPSENPYFFNWNRVKLRYCDGASFAGDVEHEVKDGSKLFFRGLKIWQEIMNELLSKGLAVAQKALLSGCSAGGLATFLHCDDFQSLLPKDATVKCLADGGFFLNEKDISGKSTMLTFYHEVVTLQDVAKVLPNGCTSRKKPSQCFFPESIIESIRTPLFIVNPAYDFWQIQNVLAPDSADPSHEWDKCKRSIDSCTGAQIKVLQEFRNKLLTALNELPKSKSRGLFVNSCFAHCQTWIGSTWHSADSPRLSNKTIAEAVGDWYFDREEVKLIDCPYSCNPTCHNANLL
ncbi:pectin acetylesterase 5-like [Nymphaea colorata]|nr:pectin acetylesterase 5-like [Nymphaea colorata]